jgi:toxin FitB
VSSQPQYLLDTNVLSETRKKQANERVVSFLSNVEPSSLYISVLTLGELRKGIAIKAKSDPDAARKLSSWVDGLEYSFADRILSIDTKIASLWGQLCAERSRPVIDTLLAATAISHKLVLVTRNTNDVAGIKVSIVNPWKQ